MSSELTVFQPKDLDQALRLADMLSKATVLPDALRNKPGDVLAIIIKGQELGLTAMQAIGGIHVIKGKTVMSADLQVAIVKRHRDCEFFRLVQSTDTAASYETKRKGEEPTKMSFTLEQAQKAGLSGGDNWRKYPAAMLRARCSSALARAVYPDLMLGVYEEDEAREFSPPEREVGSVVTGQRTAQVKAELAAKVARLKGDEPKALPASKVTVVDVAPGETEAQAEQRQASTPWQKVSFLMLHAGKSGKQAAEFLKGVTGKTDRKALDESDVSKVQDALDVLRAEAGAEEPPPINDSDIPAGVTT